MIAVMRTNSSKQRYQNDESRGGESGNFESKEMTDDEENSPDYEHLLNVISDNFNQLIATFYQNNTSAMIGTSLARVKESYEEIINSIVENLSQQIESLQGEVEVFGGENQVLKDHNSKLQKQLEMSEKNNQQVASFAKQNEVLGEELNRLYEENKALKKD